MGDHPLTGTAAGLLRATTAGAIALATLAAAPRIARAADARAIAAPGGGLDALELVVDTRAGEVRTRRCRTATSCDPAAPAHIIPIPLERARLDPATVAIDVIEVGEGRRVVHARIPDSQRKDLAFEVVASARSDDPVFAGLTGYTAGAEGDRSGSVVLVYDRDASSKFVIVAESREDTRICGQALTPLVPRGLDPRTLTLRGATLHRLEKKARDAASRLLAQVRAEGSPPLARVMVATGSSAPDAAKLTDGKHDTAWSETRPGDGHGEFVTMRTAEELPLAGLRVTVSPTGATAPPSGSGAAPRTFFVATDDQLFHVTMPEDAWSRPGRTYEVLFKGEVRTSCAAVVLDEAYDAGKRAPEVTLAEVAAITRFDAENATLDDVARALSTPRAEEAAALLKRAGEAGLAAVMGRMASLDPRGRALAVDVAASAGSCDGVAVDLLTRALTDKDVEVKRRALGRIERCGKAAGASLAAAVASDDEERRAATAPVLATVAPAAALEPLAAQLGKGAPATRRAVRSAFARAAASTPREKLLGLLTEGRASAKPEPAPGEPPSPPRDTAAHVDLLRGMGARLAELRPESDAALADLLRARKPDFTTRFLLLQPLAHLARAQGATTGELTTLADLARRDPEWPVRARAVELASGIAPLGATLVAATGDPEPRVREAALKAIGSSALAAGARAATTALRTEAWTFVRVAAAEALASLPLEGATTTELAKALGDASPRVRAAALAALGKQRAVAHAGKVADRLDDTREDPEVRALAARTLGLMCEHRAADRLTKLALFAKSPVDEADEPIGVAAIDALGALHPADLEKRLSPLRGKEVRPPLRRAVEHALASPGTCR